MLTAITQKAAASVALTKYGAATLAALLSFTLAEVTTGQAVLAALLAFFSAVLAAWLASRPALIQAKTAREQLHTTEAAQAHAERVAFLEERIRYNTQVLVLTRGSKHKLLTYAQELTAYARNLQDLLSAAEGKAPPFVFKTYDELCGDEDKALVALTVPAEVWESKGKKGG